MDPLFAHHLHQTRRQFFGQMGLRAGSIALASLLAREQAGAAPAAGAVHPPLPGLPHGKPAGMPCPHLDEALRCRLFGQPERPAVCGSLQPSAEMCGETREQALRWLTDLETATR